MTLLSEAYHRDKKKQEMLQNRQTTAETKLYLNTPEIYTSPVVSDNYAEYFQKLVFTLREDAKLSAFIFQEVAEANKNVKKGELIREKDRNLLLNMSELFYSNLYHDEKNSMSENNAFLRAFQYYLFNCTKDEDFGIDEV